MRAEIHSSTDCSLELQELLVSTPVVIKGSGTRVSIRTTIKRAYFTKLLTLNVILTIVNTMKVMTGRTRLSPEKVIERVKSYFNGKFGLEIVEETPGCCVELANNLGFVNAQVVDNGNYREVTLTTREWEYQIQEFLGQLK
jgi:hypothetical protein